MLNCTLHHMWRSNHWVATRVLTSQSAYDRNSYVTDMQTCRTTFLFQPEPSGHTRRRVACDARRDAYASWPATPDAAPELRRDACLTATAGGGVAMAPEGASKVEREGSPKVLQRMATMATMGSSLKQAIKGRPSAEGRSSAQGHADTNDERLTKDHSESQTSFLGMFRQQQTDSYDAAVREARLASVIPTKAWYVIDPRTNRRIAYWDIFTCSALLFTAIITPVEVAFLQPPKDSEKWQNTLFIANRWVDLIFIMGEPAHSRPTRYPPASNARASGRLVPEACHLPTHPRQMRVPAAS